MSYYAACVVCHRWITGYVYRTQFNQPVHEWCQDPAPYRGGGVALEAKPEAGQDTDKEASQPMHPKAVKRDGDPAPSALAEAAGRLAPGAGGGVLYYRKLHAYHRAGYWLAEANRLIESGKKGTKAHQEAERKAQYWLDRLNVLEGNGE